MERNSLLYNPKLYTASSVLIAFLLIGDLTAIQQNALGNWFMNIGQILESNSSFQQVIEEMFKGNTYNINSKQFKNGGSPIMDNEPILEYFKNTDDGQKAIKELEKMIDNLRKRIDELYKKG